MAKQLKFPIGFDLKAGTKQAIDDWKSTYRQKVQDAVDKKPIKLKLAFDAKGLNLKQLKQYMTASKEVEKLRREALKTQKEDMKLQAEKEKRDKAALATERERVALEGQRKRDALSTSIREQQLEAAKQRTIKATNSAIKSQTNLYRTQDGLLARLGEKAMVYFGAHQIIRFVKNIKDVTKEMELQRTSLGALIGNMQTADKIYAQINDAAIKSPFNISQLTKYTKQLAAYKIKTDELFNTTMRLADISAGLGVEMDRIILAYGQIRATGYLRATEVRQLTEAGIPIVEALAEKLTAVNGELVTAGQVMGMISDRAVSFELVKQVFEDMTDAGGMFYKMQEKQAKTLYGQWENLKDAATIMYSEIGGTRKVHGAMENMIKLSAYLLNHWEALSSIAKSVFYSFIAFKTVGPIIHTLGGALKHPHMMLKLIGAELKVVGKAMLSAFPIAAIASIVTLIDEFVTSYKDEKKALEDSNKAWDERGRKLQDIANAYYEISDAASKADQADRAFAKNLYGKKLEQLQKLINEMKDYGLNGVINLGYIDEGNIDKVFDTWIKKMQEAQNVGRAFGNSIASLNNAFEGTIFGWSLFGENLKSDMQDLAKSWNDMVLSQNLADSLEDMRTSIDTLYNTEGMEAYTQELENLLGVDAKLAIAQRQRNETEYEYQKRLIANYNKIAGYLGRIGAYLPLKGLKWSFDTVNTQNFKNDLEEVMSELRKYGTVFMEQDPLSVRMAIDIAAAENEWYDWQKEAIIDMINRDRLQAKLEIIPTIAGADNSEVASGFKARLMSEFKGLFTEDELNKLVTPEEVMKAIAEKFKDAKSKYAQALKLDEDPEIKDSTLASYQRMIDDTNAKIETEQAKPSAEQDKAKLKNLQEQKLALVGIHETEKLRIKTSKEMTKSAYELAKAAHEAFTAVNKTAIASDVKTQFPELFSTNEANISGSQFSFQITDEELEKANNVAEIYDLWASKMQDVNKRLEEHAKWGMSEKDVQLAQQKLDLQQASNNARLEEIEQELTYIDATGKGYAEYAKLQEQLNTTTDIREREKIEARINELLQDGNLDRFVTLTLEKQRRQQSNEKLNVAKAANEEILAYLQALSDAKKSLTDMGKRYNFSLPTKGGGKSNTDEWIILMKNRMKFMQDFDRGYDALAKKMQNNEALLQEQSIMMNRGLRLGIDSKEIKDTTESLRKWYQDAITQISDKIQKLGGAEWKGLGVEAILAKDTKSLTIRKLQELLSEIYAEMTNFETDEVVKAYEKKLKDLTEKVSRTRVAQDFFDKILNITGNKEYAMNLTMSLYGIEGDVGDAMAKAVKDKALALFEGVDISDVFDAEDNIDYTKLQKHLPKLEADDDRTKAAKDFVEEGLKAEANWFSTIEKMYEKVFSFEERRTRIRKREAENRKAIEAKSELDPKEKKRLTDASYKLEDEEIAKLNLEQLKESEDWITVFEDIDRVGTRSITHVMNLIKEFIDTNSQIREMPTELRALMSEYDKLYEATITRNPFKAISSGLKEYFQALRQVTKARSNEGVVQARKEERAAEREYKAAQKEYKEADATDEAQLAAVEKLVKAEDRLKKAKENRAKAEAKLRKAQDAQVKALNKVQKGVNDSINAFNAMGEVASIIQDTFNVDEASDFGVALTSIGQALTMVAGVLGVVNAMITLIETHPLVLALSAAIMAIIGGIMLFNNLKTRDAEKEIERLNGVIEDLEYAYERLEKAQEKAFSDEYIANYEQRLANLMAQQDAYLAQADAERSKGKKADEDKIKEYEESARDAADAIKDMSTEISEHFLGTDLTSAARDFAKAWIDAYKEFGNTTDAMSEKFQEMIHNMVVESFAAKIMQSALDPIFSEIDKMTKDGVLDMSEASYVAAMANEAVANMDVGMSNLLAALEAAGLSVRGMGGDLTGISRDIATASEESILGLSAGIGTQNFYISQIPTKIDEIIGILRGAGGPNGTQVTLQDLVSLQNQHLSYLPTIAQHTQDTVEQCRLIVYEAKRTADALSSVIKPTGVQTTHVLTTSIKN